MPESIISPSTELRPEAGGEPLKAFLVGFQRRGETAEDAQELLDELGALADTLGLASAGGVLAKLREINRNLVVGAGKAEEICRTAEACGADVIILNDFLTPSQQRNWEDLAGRAVIDRQEVILDIFAARARTSEAVLQIALAQANYSLPRLKRRWTHLNRQRGMTGGRGGRAGGEQQLELDSRQVRGRIARLKSQLEEVRRQRQVQRSRRLRKPVPVAAIVGYTNAGKSSLLNAMTDARVLTEDRLFATLDPTVRRITLPGGQDLLLADTVGFIRNLPHLLIEAFKSTLEETLLADYLVEVLDATAPRIDEHHQATAGVLREIGIDRKQTVLVLNKADLAPDNRRRELLRRFPDALLVSARTGEGLDDLARELTLQTTAIMDTMLLLIPHTRYDLVNRIRRTCSIEEQEYTGDGVFFKARVPQTQKELLREFQIHEPRPAAQ